MAQAIERSHTVIICMSEQYRKSNYCRAEAHYAFQRQLRIVPVLLQKHYQPDSWLLFLIGQLLYVDFTNVEFPRAMEKLIKELRASGMRQTQMVPVQSEPDPNVVISPSSEVSTLPENLLDWTQTDVKNWLIGCNLIQMARLLADFDGSSLNSLSELVLGSDSQQILTLFQEDSLRRTNENISLLELARFRALLNERQQIMKKCTDKRNRVTDCQMM
jgi:hypothetical protein